MALRTPMLLLLSGTFAGGVAATYIAPKVVSTLLDSEPPAQVLVASAEAAGEPKQANEAGKETVGTTCKEAVWPYLDSGCGAESTASRPERQVRVISTDRDAPSRVPIPTPAVAPAAAVQVASVPEGPEPAAPEQVASTDGDDTKAAPVAVLPPEKPVFAPARRENVAKAETAPAASADPVETTGSINPAAPAVAKPRQPAKRHAARVERPRHDMERIRQARRNFDEDEDTVVQTTTYQYADGRQLVFRSEPRQQERRRWIEDEPMEPIRRIEPQPIQPARGGILGWLVQ